MTCLGLPRILWLPASLALFAACSICGQSQISSAPAHSAAPPTSSFVAPPTGVVSPRTGAVAPPTGFPSGRVNSASRSFQGFGTHSSTHHHHRGGTAQDFFPYYYPYAYFVPVPFGADAEDDVNAEDDADYQGGPTVFDRRGYGEQSYIPPYYSGPAHPQPPASDDRLQAENSAPADLPSPQPPTTLVFKDGRHFEISNYAIVRQTLYDPTPGHARRIALAELDLPATQKENDDRGVIFQLPAPAQAN